MLAAGGVSQLAKKPGCTSKGCVLSSQCSCNLFHFSKGHTCGDRGKSREHSRKVGPQVAVCADASDFVNHVILHHETPEFTQLHKDI